MKKIFLLLVIFLTACGYQPLFNVEKNNAEEYLQKMMKEKIWIYSVDPENWKVVLNHNVWASSVDIEKIGERIHQNDYVIFFVTGTKKFKGIFKFSKKLIYSCN